MKLVDENQVWSLDWAKFMKTIYCRATWMNIGVILGIIFEGPHVVLSSCQYGCQFEI